jgi:hypothetical protein
MDALFADSCCKAVWARIRGKPPPFRVDPTENFSLDDEKGKTDVRVEHVEHQEDSQTQKREM